MKILLIRPKPHKKTINLQSFMICEPLELEYCASMLEFQGHNVTIFDGILEKSFPKVFPYDLVGITGYICHVGIIKEYAAKIKAYNKNIITVVGGVHAEVVGEDFIDKNIDHILKIGGLQHISDIASGKNFNASCYVEKTFNYPYPNREKTSKYRDKYNYVFHENCATIKTSFGCSYNCDFCFCTRVSPYFTRDVNDVINEIKTIKENNIFIVDDNFLFDKQRIEKFCNLLDINNIKKNFIAFGRADFIAQNEDVIKLLSIHGFEAIFVGLESFKLNELKNMNKKTSVEENILAVKTLERHGMRCYAGIIVGFDWEKVDFDNLINYLNSFNNIFVNIQPITPMPGTPLFEKYKNKIIIPREKYEYWDMAHLILNPTKMSKRAFYYHIVRAYLKTITSKKSRIYIKNEFGKRTYRRVKSGAKKIFWQYFKLIIKGK